MKIALTILCENPLRKTGLTSLFHELVSHSLKIFPEVSWLIFAGPNQEWNVIDNRVEIIRDFPANDHLGRRLLADHFQVSPAARACGADILVTVGFVPARKCLPTAMHVLSLQAFDKHNRIGLFRGIYRRWMMKYRWSKADLVFVNSHWAADQALAFCPALHNRIVISYEGLQREIFNTLVAPDERQQLKEKFGILPGYLLWVSNFYPYKQPERLITGYARLDPEMRCLHPLVMAGGDWLGGLDAAKAQAKSLGVERDVKFLGWVGDCWLAPLYRHAAAFCLASREETFGRCVIEAMACGAPCIVGDIPTMREVADGHALLVNFHDTEAVTNALKKILTDPASAAQLRVKGLTRARQFTFEKLAAERIAAIQRLVSTCKRPGL